MDLENYRVEVFCCMVSAVFLLNDISYATVRVQCLLLIDIQVISTKIVTSLVM